MLFLKNEKLSVILLILLRDEVQDAFNGNYFNGKVFVKLHEHATIRR